MKKNPFLLNVLVRGIRANGTAAHKLLLWPLPCPVSVSKVVGGLSSALRSEFPQGRCRAKGRNELPAFLIGQDELMWPLLASLGRATCRLAQLKVRMQLRSEINSTAAIPRRNAPGCHPLYCTWSSHSCLNVFLSSLGMS